MIRSHDSTSAPPACGTARSYVALAAGGDLGALVPLIAARLLDEPLSSILVFYGHYGEVSEAALEVLLALKDQNLGRLALHFIMEREPEEGELLAGKLDADKLRGIAAELFDPLAVHQYFLLGTGSAVAPLRAQLLDLGVAPEKIHADGGAAAAPRASEAADAPAPATGETQVEVVMDGRRRTFSMHTGTESILEAASRAGLDLPFSCRAGVCSTCRTKLVRGEVELAQNYALEDWELAQGFILACQAHAKTAELEITYDET
ncbi:MAG TPA: 2Fe-2S iron-sulfur cluster-binding protein [Steroidobacteraceae bacterium]